MARVKLEEEKRLGFNVENGILRPGAVKAYPPLKDLVKDLLSVLEDFKTFNKTQLRLSEAFTLECMELFNTHAANVWPEISFIPPWLHDARVNDLEGLYPENLTYIKDHEWLVECLLDMMYAKASSYRNNRRIRERRFQGQNDNANDDDYVYESATSSPHESIYADSDASSLRDRTDPSGNLSNHIALRPIRPQYNSPYPAIVRSIPESGDRNVSLGQERSGALDKRIHGSSTIGKRRQTMEEFRSGKRRVRNETDHLPTIQTPTETLGSNVETLPSALAFLPYQAPTAQMTLPVTTDGNIATSAVRTQGTSARVHGQGSNTGDASTSARTTSHPPPLPAASSILEAPAERNNQAVTQSSSLPDDAREVREDGPIPDVMGFDGNERESSVMKIEFAPVIDLTGYSPSGSEKSASNGGDIHERVVKSNPHPDGEISRPTQDCGLAASSTPCGEADLNTRRNSETATLTGQDDREIEPGNENGAHEDAIRDQIHDDGVGKDGTADILASPDRHNRDTVIANPHAKHVDSTNGAVVEIPKLLTSDDAFANRRVYLEISYGEGLIQMDYLDNFKTSSDLFTRVQENAPHELHGKTIEALRLKLISGYLHGMHKLYRIPRNVAEPAFNKLQMISKGPSIGPYVELSVDIEWAKE